MPFVRLTESPVLPVTTTLPIGTQDEAAGRTHGWQVLAILQFFAAGSLVLALASRIFFPHGFRNACLQNSPLRAALGVHRTVCVGYQWPSSRTRVSKARPRAAHRPLMSVARVSREERSPLLSPSRAAPGALAPPR